MDAETQSPGAVLQNVPTIEALLRAGLRLLEGHSASPRLDAELLLAHALGATRTALFLRRAEPVGHAAAEAYLAAIGQRRSGRPVAQLTGTREFWSLPLAVTPDVLVPRPETELLVERALARLPARATPRVLDLGTGSGAVALAIASERPDCEVLATDLSAAALEVAGGNAVALGLGRVRFAAGDWYAAAGDAPFDVIVSNPPYLADEELAGADPGLAFEPRIALTSGAEGLDALRTIAAGARAHLRPGGWLLVEHAPAQGEAVRELFRAAGLDAIATLPDLAARPRVTEARRPA